MEKLLEYLLENLRQLTAFHLLLVAMLTVVTGTAMFFIFRWLYTGRFEAQHDVLGLRAERIEEYKTRVAELEQHSERLSEQVQETQHALATATAAQKKLSAAAFKSWYALLFLMYVSTLQQFRASVWSWLAFYADLPQPLRELDPDAPSLYQLRERLDDIGKTFDGVDFSLDAFERLAPVAYGDAEGQIPAGFHRFPFSETSAALHAVHDDISAHVDRVFQQWKALSGK